MMWWKASSAEVDNRMALVKSGDIDFELPVLTVTAIGERWTCRNLDHLTRIVPIQLRRGRFLGMKITDASGRRWVVRSIRKIGRADPWHIMNILLLFTPDWRVEYELEELPPRARRGAGSTKGARSPARNRKESSGDEAVKLAGTAPDLLSDTGKGYGATGHRSFASKVDFDYPVVGFTQHQGALGFDDLGAMTRCAPAYVRNASLIGMEMVDNRLRRWIVRSLDLKAPLEEKRWWQIYKATRYAEFDLELEEAAPISLADLKRRLVEEWELEDPDDAKAVRRAPDLATMFAAAHQQGSGLL